MQSFLKDNTLLDAEKIETFVTGYTQEITSVSSNSRRPLMDDKTRYMLYSKEEAAALKMIHLGKLLETRWKVCSFVGDAKHREVNKIYVEMSLSVQNSNGDILTDSFVLTLSEFKVRAYNFSSHL